MHLTAREIALAPLIGALFVIVTAGCTPARQAATPTAVGQFKPTITHHNEQDAYPLLLDTARHHAETLPSRVHRHSPQRSS